MPDFVKNEARAARRARLREELLDALGWSCATCGSEDALEVHHVDGRTYSLRGLNAEARLYRYRAELRAGVRLQTLCRGCNGGLNQHTYGTREEEVPF